MSFPTWHGHILYPNISIQFPDEGGLSVTIPELPTVSEPAGTSNPSLCISQSNDGDLSVSIPSGMTATIPLDQIQQLFLNGTKTTLPSPKLLRLVLKFPSGGTIRWTLLKKRVWVEGLEATMDPLP